MYLCFIHKAGSSTADYGVLYQERIRSVSVYNIEVLCTRVRQIVQQNKQKTKINML